MALCGVMWRYEIGVFFAFFAFCRKICEKQWRYVALCGAMKLVLFRVFCVFPKFAKFGKTVALCGVMWRYEIGAFFAFLRFPKICEIWEKQWRYVALCGAMKVVLFRIVSRFLRFSENLRNLGKTVAL